MRPLIVNQSDYIGGASRAAVRLVQALRRAQTDARMLVVDSETDFHWVSSHSCLRNQVASSIRRSISSKLARMIGTVDHTPRSPNLLSSALPRAVGDSDADVVNVHWIGAEAMSVADAAGIAKPLIWTMHDMWLFCGAEHYTSDDSDSRWRNGYTRENRPSNRGGVDIDAWTWRRKRRHFRVPGYAISPSNWLGDCARESKLLEGWDIRVIPNPLDLRLFRPWPRTLARHLLGLPEDVPLIGYGAVGGTRDPRKGWDLLRAAIQHLADARTQAEGVVFGQSQPLREPDVPMKLHWAGRISDEPMLALLYSAVDLVVVPSRLDNLPQTATEAQACGSPVVAFNTGGLSDAVEHGVTGHLAPVFDVDDFAKAIIAILSDRACRDALGGAARARALRLWDESVVIPQYLDAYRQAIDAHK